MVSYHYFNPLLQTNGKISCDIFSNYFVIPLLKDKKWYYCDTCDRMTANAKIDSHTGKYVELELHCPFSTSIALNLTDIGIDVNQNWINSNLVSLCRQECL